MQHYSLVEDLIDHSIFLLKAYTMMFSYHQVKERPKLLLAMTGLTHAEFAQLLPHFQSAWEQYVHRIDTMLVRWFPQRAAVGKLLFHKPKHITMEEKAHDHRSDSP